jgi:hypothetical protein
MNVLRPNGRGEYSQRFSVGTWILVAAVGDLPWEGLCCEHDFLRTLLPLGTTVTLARGESKTLNLTLHEIAKR